jgi:hypothetical protein
MRLTRVAVFLLVAAFSASGPSIAQQNKGSLQLPPIAKDPSAIEILTVWAAPGKVQQFTIRSTYKDPAAWGLLLVDIARHVSRAYAAEGEDEKRVLERIRSGFEAEWSNPTDIPKTIEIH